MKRWGYVIVLVALGAGACWKTKPNPGYQPDGGVDGGRDASAGDLATRCTKDSECTVAAPRCDTGAGVCGACTSSDSCAGRGSTLTCDTTTGDALAGQCVGCVKEADCATAGQACVANACVTCTQNSDCENGICDTATCVAASSILFVNNSPGAGCLDTAHMSSVASPYCNINTAVSQATSTQRFVSVAGSSSNYGPITWTTAGIELVIVGPGKNGSPMASVSGSGSALNVNSSSGSVTITIDGLALEGSGPGVTCGVPTGTSTAGVTLRDVWIHDGNDVAISSSRCALHLLQSLVSGNKGGISVTGGTYTIENNFVSQNSSMTSPGVIFDSTATGTFDFNTVVNNATTAMHVAGGVSCGGGQTLTSSIISGNRKNPDSASQIDGSCALVTSIIEANDSTTQGTHQDPAFMADGYHLVVGNAVNGMYVTNQLMSGPALDGDDIARPINVRWDIGADEAE